MHFSIKRWIRRLGCQISTCLFIVIWATVTCGNDDLFWRQTQIQANGDIVGWSNSLSGWINRPNASNRMEVTYGFGMPTTPPLEQQKEYPNLRKTVWVCQGIRYTQSVLVTLPGDGSLMVDDPSVLRVMLVHLKGESISTEYTNATAVFTVSVAGKALALRYEDDAVAVGLEGGSSIVAVVELPSGGGMETNRTNLLFYGSMPPASLGSMTFKIPSRAVQNPADVERLKFLDFEDELERSRRFWEKRKK